MQGRTKISIYECATTFARDTFCGPAAGASWTALWYALQKYRTRINALQIFLSA